MGEGKHTPGPWKLFDGWGASKEKPVIVDSIPDVDGKCVANCIAYVATSNVEFHANARLLAAAPDLLAACKEARDWMPTESSYHCRVRAQLRAAIAKAEGAMSERRFPLLKIGRSLDDPDSIPWSVAEEAYAKYREKWHGSQTLERLAQRGGFGVSEMDEFVPDWRVKAEGNHE